MIPRFTIYSLILTVLSFANIKSGIIDFVIFSKNESKFDIGPEFSNLENISMLDTKSVGDNYKMLVTVLTILVTNIHYLFT